MPRIGQDIEPDIITIYQKTSTETAASDPIPDKPRKFKR